MKSVVNKCKQSTEVISTIGDGKDDRNRRLALEIGRRIREQKSVQGQFLEQFQLVLRKLIAVPSSRSKKNQTKANEKKDDEKSLPDPVLLPETTESRPRVPPRTEETTSVLLSTPTPSQKLRTETQNSEVAVDECVVDESNAKIRSKVPVEEGVNTQAPPRSSEWGALIDAIFPRTGGINVHEKPLQYTSLKYM